MILNRRVFRNLAAMASFHIVAGVLTALVVAFALATLTTSATLNRVVPDFLSANAVEDASFTTVRPLAPADVDDLKEEFGVALAAQESLDVRIGHRTLRLLDDQDEVNVFAVSAGRAPTANREIALSQRFAEANGYAIGDRLDIGGVELTVVGTGVRPDYLYPLRDLSDAYPNFEEFGTAITTAQTLSEFGAPSVHYVVRSAEGVSLDFRRQVDERFGMLEYQPASANQRIEFGQQSGQSLQRITTGFTPLVAALVLMIMALVLGRKVRAEQQQIGALTALGYRKRELTGHYVWFAVLPGVVGTVLGLLLGWSLLETVCAVYFADLDAIGYDIRVAPGLVVACCVAPVVSYGLVAVGTLSRLLRRPTVELLRRAAEGRRPVRLGGASPKWRRNLKWRSIVGHPGRSVVVVSAVIVAGLCVLFGMALRDSVSSLVAESARDIRYEYTYALTRPVTEVPDDAEGVLALGFETTDGDSQFQVWGLDADSRFVDPGTAEATSKDSEGYYVTTAMAGVLDISPGDELPMRRVTTLEEDTVKVAGLVDDDVTMAVYTGRDSLGELTGIDSTYSTILLSEKELDLGDGVVASSLSREQTRDALSQVLDLFQVAAVIIIAFGFLLGVLLVYVITDMLVEDQASMISLFKVLGYTQREIDGFVLGTNHVLVVGGFLASLPLTLAACTAVFAGTGDSIGVALPVVLDWRSAAGGAVIVFASYAVSLLLLRRKTMRIDMVESLKDNRE